MNPKKYRELVENKGWEVSRAYLESTYIKYDFGVYRRSRKKIWMASKGDERTFGDTLRDLSESIIELETRGI